MPTNKEFANWF